jgi:hypothetical protein
MIDQKATMSVITGNNLVIHTCDRNVGAGVMTHNHGEEGKPEMHCKQ